jgi:adenine deaminase
MDLDALISTARGDAPADLLLTNAKIVNVFTGTVSHGSLAVRNGWIAAVGDRPAKQTVDLGGRYAAPGFIDGHLHIESSMTCVSEFARAVLPCGTTTVVADPHEIANVLGTAGIDYMLASAEGQPMNIYYSLSSCVPATDMETSGARLEAADLEPYFERERIVALAEMMNYPGVIYRDPAVLAKIIHARQHRKPVDGHAPGLSGNDLSAYAAAGIGSDHECTTAEEALEKLAAGMHIMIREGTGARNLEALLPVVTPATSRRVMWCTDDRHPHDLLRDGHIDAMIRQAISGGLDPVTAIRAATLNPAEYFNLPHLGALAPGRQADLVVFSDLQAPQVEAVYCRGRLVARQGRMTPDTPRPAAIPVPPSMRVDTSTLNFEIPAQGDRMRVIDLIADQIVTRQEVVAVSHDGGLAVADTRQDLLKIAVVERHAGSGRIGKGFVKGFGMKRGALASSVAHDSHNIIVVGADDRDMTAAVAAVADMGGGLAAADGGRVIGRLPLPVGGLMSNEPVQTVRDQLDALLALAHQLGAAPQDPFMTLSFLALPVIPELKITDKGLVDVGRFDFVPLFTES